MKSRTSFVSNSSSSSFIVRGIKLSLDEVFSKLNIKIISDDLEERVNDIDKYFESYDIGLAVYPVKNFFNPGYKFTDVIIGIDTNADIEDGLITDITPSSEIDFKVMKNLVKAGLAADDNPSQLRLFVQYISNDNC